ncbi:hypothetical protein [Cupriavidus sp. WS]|uniref:hypothetical protein n=1 Tax=Cupriavidus sp. WS TaxID=1312922 RepID=UPI0012DFB58B|nr:hypothetical protein [Cupriavidus sp. WS]
MNNIATLVMSAALLAVGTANVAWADATDDANARELAKALQEHMVSTYSCQKFLGGLAHYRAAKTLAVETYSRVTGNRNQAVLTIDGIEQKIKASKFDKQMEAQFKEMKLSEIDSMGTCQDLIAESLDKVEVLQAKLHLL